MFPSFPKNLAGALAATLLTFFASVSDALAAGHTEHTDFDDGTILGFLEYLPTDYGSTTDQYPLIIYLHGAGGRSTSGEANFSLMENEGLPGVLQDSELPFIVISPQVRFTWNSTAANLDAFLDFLLLRDERIDPERVFVTGISDGGKGVFDFPLTYRDRLAGIIPVSSWPSDSQSQPIATAPFSDDPPLPIWGFHGDADTYSSMETWLSVVENEGGEVQFTLLPGGHTSAVWGRVYGGETFSFKGTDYTVFEWMQTLSNPEALNHVPQDPSTIKDSMNLSGDRRLAYEGFDLVAGGVDGMAGTSSRGWREPWVSMEGIVLSEGLAFDNLGALGGALELPAAASGSEVAAMRELPYAVGGSDGVVWCSLLVETPTAGGSTGESLKIALRGNQAVPREIWVGTAEGGSTWVVGGSGLALDGAEMVSTDVSIEANLSTWVVLKLDFEAASGALWIDPSPIGGIPALSGGTTFDLQSEFFFDRLQLSFEGATAFGGTLVDEVRLGTTFAAVASEVWSKWPVVAENFVNTAGSINDLGWLYLGAKPWVYSYGLETWIYLPESLLFENGMWGYTSKK